MVTNKQLEYWKKMKGHKVSEETRKKIGKTMKKIAIEDYKMDFSKCQICGDKKRKIHLHHHNGNYFDNRRENLGIVCSYCHNAIHDNPNRKATRFQIGHLPYKHGVKL